MPGARRDDTCEQGLSRRLLRVKPRTILCIRAPKPSVSSPPFLLVVFYWQLLIGSLPGTHTGIDLTHRALPLGTAVSMADSFGCVSISLPWKAGKVSVGQKISMLTYKMQKYYLVGLCADSGWRLQWLLVMVGRTLEPTKFRRADWTNNPRPVRLEAPPSRRVRRRRRRRIPLKPPPSYAVWLHFTHKQYDKTKQAFLKIRKTPNTRIVDTSATNSCNTNRPVRTRYSNTLRPPVGAGNSCSAEAFFIFRECLRFKVDNQVTGFLKYMFLWQYRVRAVEFTKNTAI